MQYRYYNCDYLKVFLHWYSNLHFFDLAIVFSWNIMILGMGYHTPATRWYSKQCSWSLTTIRVRNMNIGKVPIILLGTSQWNHLLSRSSTVCLSVDILCTVDNLTHSTCTLVTSLLFVLLLKWPTWLSSLCHSHCYRKGTMTGQTTLVKAKTVLTLSRILSWAIDTSMLIGKL